MPPMLLKENCRMSIRQQPMRAQVVQENNPKNRKPIDPPPIIELKYNAEHDPINANWMVSPRTFMMVTLVAVKDGQDEHVPGKYLIGQTVSSLHRLKDINNKDGGFFVFGDISARKLGTYKLRFSLFDTAPDAEDVHFMGVIDTDPFPVLPQRDFGSMSESTHLTRTFSDQGVKLRVRKDNRAISGIGNKRSYNTSPPDTTPPSTQPGTYGGGATDHYSAHSPGGKRQRSSGDYEGSHLYQHMPVGEPPMPHYTSAIPSGTRSWSNEQQRMHGSYSQQTQSPMSMPMMNRVQQTVSVPGANGWQNMNQQQTALPSPSSSGSNQQPSYPAVAGQQQQPSLFGDPGSAASAIPRQYYNNSYQYQAQGQYQNQIAESQSTYPDLQMPGSSIPDSGGLASAHNQAYSSGYIQSNGSLYASETGEAPAPYAYMGNSQHHNL
ncbi:developmental regulator like protein [Zymoseptoria brevis]|uniref:Developmental regulator like protein n=1 Tax=Zymoseptoria brevis TaxID=1047168 RepID=A0A0F4GTH7_9PEZI|nr:developmental regulator like protein [Zymoseptoria brevis]